MCVCYQLHGMSRWTTVWEAFQGQDIWKKNYYYYSASLSSYLGLKVKLLFYTTSDRLMWTVVHDQSSAVIMYVHDLGSHATGSWPTLVNVERRNHTVAVTVSLSRLERVKRECIEWVALIFSLSKRPLSNGLEVSWTDNFHSEMEVLVSCSLRSRIQLRQNVRSAPKDRVRLMHTVSSQCNRNGYNWLMKEATDNRFDEGEDDYR